MEEKNADSKGATASDENQMKQMNSSFPRLMCQEENAGTKFPISLCALEKENEKKESQDLKTNDIRKGMRRERAVSQNENEEIMPRDFDFAFFFVSAFLPSCCRRSRCASVHVHHIPVGRRWQ